MTERKPILVTGIVRSGSTWTGRMIAASPSVCYLHEPFNRVHRPGLCAVKFEQWFPYITAENEHLFYPAVKDTVALRYNIKRDITSLVSLTDITSIARGLAKFNIGWILRKRPLLKDPLAVLSAPWLAERFDMNIVVVIRHPAAVVSSVLLKNWEHPFQHFLDQPLLMRDYLQPFREEIEDYTAHRYSKLEQAILLWRIIHFVLLRFKEDHPEWLFVRHEDLSRAPILEFRKIYGRLGLVFTSRIQRVIEKHTDIPHSVDSVEDMDSIRRNSRENISTWKRRLSKADIERIREGTASIAGEFYSEDDW